MDSLNGFPSLAVEAWPAVTIYLPNDMIENKKGVKPAIRLRNLLHEADAKLEALGIRAPDRHTLLAPALKLLEQDAFWDHQEKGLALFLAPNLFHQVAMPMVPPELVTVGRRFQVRPLLPLRLADNRFWLLAISAGRVRLLRCSRSLCDEVVPKGMPAGVGEVSGETDFQEGLQFNPMARPHNRGASGVVKSHGFESPEEVRKAELLEYLHRVESAILPDLNRDSLPLVIAAEPEILGHFSSMCHYPRLHGEAVKSNPFALREEELRERAFALLEPGFLAPAAALQEQIMTRLGSAEPTVTLKLEEIVAAAGHSRVAGLLIAENVTLWGKLDEEKTLAVTHGTPGPDDEDLVNYAAVMSIANGAPVYSLPRAQMPRQAIAAATLRY